MITKNLKILVVLLVFLLFGSVYAQEAVATDGVELVRLKFGGGSDWYNGPTELPNLAKFVRERTGINVFATGKYVEPASEEIFKYPFIFMTGHGNCYFTDEEAANLRRWMEAGGFLLVNDDYGLDKAFRREVKKIFPDRELVELPFEHEIYHCYYDFPSGLPKIHEHDGKPPQGFGIFVDGRLVLFYVYESDIADGWDDPSVHGDPPEKRLAALKMGTNILIYALTH